MKISQLSGVALGAAALFLTGRPAPAQVIVRQAPVVVAPAPVVVRPAPVLVSPAPVLVRPAPVFVSPVVAARPVVVNRRYYYRPYRRAGWYRRRARRW
jgi:hypothetical protein